MRIGSITSRLSVCARANRFTLRGFFVGSAQAPSNKQCQGARNNVQRESERMGTCSMKILQATCNLSDYLPKVASIDDIHIIVRHIRAVYMQLPLFTDAASRRFEPTAFGRTHFFMYSDASPTWYNCGMSKDFWNEICGTTSHWFRRLCKGAKSTILCCL